MVDFILFKPQNSGNIGMAVRALANLKMPPLQIVGRRQWRDAEVRKLAASASAAVDQIVFHDHIEEIYENYHVILGTTAKPRTDRTILPLAKLGEMACDNESKGKRTALLFGPEDVGLPNEITEKCDFLLTFSVQDTIPVMNLAQTILLCAYEIHRYRQGRIGPVNPEVTLAEPQHIHQLILDLHSLLDKIEFNKSERSKRAEHILFRLVRRIELKDYELNTLRGVIRQINHVLEKKSI